MKHLVFLILATFILFSCAKKEVAKSEEKSTKNYDVLRAVDAYEAKAIDFNTFSAKVKCRYEDEKKNLSVKTTLRIQKDEKIWLSAGMFGFEGVRALVTPDSVKMINRLKREYYLESIEELQALSGLPVDFQMLQNLLTGKLLLLNGDNASINQKEGVYELLSELGQISSLAWLDDANFELIRQTMIEQAENRQMEISYHDYQPIGAARFPYESNVHVTGQNELWLDLDFSNLEINEELSFPFTISRSYKRAKL